MSEELNLAEMRKRALAMAREAVIFGKINGNRNGGLAELFVTFATSEIKRAALGSRGVLQEEPGVVEQVRVSVGRCVWVQWVNAENVVVGAHMVLPRDAEVRGVQPLPCPHCGLFGNHLSSCEYEKFAALRGVGTPQEQEPQADPFVRDEPYAALYDRCVVVVRELAALQEKTPLERYDAAHERFQRSEIRALKQTVAALVRQLTAAHLVARVTPLDLAVDPPSVLRRLDPTTGDDLLWVSVGPPHQEEKAPK